MKCVAVESTPSMVESFSETNAATFCRLAPIDEHQQVVAAGHEVARFHLVELADALGQAVEAAAAPRGVMRTSMTGADQFGVLQREIHHRPEAQQDAIFFEGVELAVQFGFG